MRDAYHEELDALSDQLVEMTRLVGSAISRATTALLDADLALAESVIAADDAIERAAGRPRGRGRSTCSPVSSPSRSDLRTIVTSLRMSADLERMGDLALHVAKVARHALPGVGGPAELRSTILEMGQVAERIVAKAGSVIATQDVDRPR